MTDAEYAAERLRVEKVCSRWHSACGLGWWTITYVWARVTQDYREGAEHGGVAATTQTHWEYRQATITWNMDATCSLNDEELELLVVHEFAHVRR